MENPAFNLVRQILRSANFLALTIDQQQAILNNILTTGEISQQDLVRIIGEEDLKLKQQDETKALALNLERLDYNTFLTIVLSGNIRGEKLLALCSGSPKLNEFCNRSFQLSNNQGIPAGPPQSQYLFRLLLDKRGISIPPDKTPRKVYIEKSIGGKVLGFGSNYAGELGIGENITYKAIPIEIPDFDNIIRVSCGYHNSLFIDSEEKVWRFGSTADHIHNFSPAQIDFKVKIIQIAAGTSHSLFLDDQNRVWSFGNNSNGQLGLSDNKERTLPVLISNLKDITQISAKGKLYMTDDSHSLCLDKQGRVWGSDLIGMVN
jgi:hypothetical protein